MESITDRLSTIGGGAGGIAAYFLNINPMHVAEIALFGLVGSLVGEGVKELFAFFRKQNIKRSIKRNAK